MLNIKYYRNVTNSRKKSKIRKKLKINIYFNGNKHKMNYRNY